MKAEYLIVNREKEVIAAVYEGRRRADAAQLRDNPGFLSTLLCGKIN